jgi:two-component system, OmpR family, sensor kinase
VRHWRKRLGYWWAHQTIRSRLALWYAAGGTLLLAGFAATLYTYVAVRMARPLDHQLRHDLDEVMRRLEVRPDQSLWWNGQDVPEHVAWTTDYPWFELWDEHGRLVQRMWPFAENRVEQVPSAPARGRDTISIFSVAPDLRLRVLSVPFHVPGRDADWMIRLMRIHEPVADALGALRLIIVVALPIVIALIVLGGYSFTRRWLVPLDRMAAEANQISADDLGRRLAVVNPHDELGRLAAVFNVTLDRLQGSFDALDRFVADASHELRTPLTTLRSVGEVALRRGRTVEEYREIIGSMLEEAQRLQLLIQRLLELATAEGGASISGRSAVRIDELAATCIAELNILAESKRQQISLDSVPCTAVTDGVLFRQALQNLVDNAIQYSPDESVIRVTIRQRAESIEVSVSDDGPGISPENRAHLMERFFRPDRGRGRNSGGFGLGLSITKAYMRVLGGSLEYQPGEPRGSTFRLLLPAGDHPLTPKQSAIVDTEVGMSGRLGG